MIAMRGALSFAIVGLLSCGSFDEASSSPPVDPTTEAGADSGGPFCGRQPSSLFLCDDFEGPTVGFKWSENATNEGGRLDRQDGALFAHAGDTPAAQGWAYLRKDLGDQTNEVIVTFSMKNTKLGVETLEVGTFYIESPGIGRYGTSFQVSPEGALTVWEFAPSKSLQQRPFDRAPLPDAWARYRFHWILTTPATLNVYLDGDPTPVVAMKLAPAFTTGVRHALVGLTHFTQPGVGVLVDDVTIERR